MRNIGRTERAPARCTSVLVGVSLALLLQCLAPPGYMAGSLDDGWPVVLCPEGLPAGFLGHHGHHHHEEGAGEDVSLDGYCPLGGMFDATAATLVPSLHAAHVHRAASIILYRSPTPSRRVESHPARAPPIPA